MKSFDESLFEVLGRLPEDATQEEINQAYKLLAQLYHPDKNPTRPEWSSENMKRLNEAKEILSDPIKRKEYEKIWKEKKSAQEHNRAKFQTTQSQSAQLNRQLQSFQKSNGELKAALGLAILVFILEAIGD